MYSDKNEESFYVVAAFLTAKQKEHIKPFPEKVMGKMDNAFRMSYLRLLIVLIFSVIFFMTFTASKASASCSVTVGSEPDSVRDQRYRVAESCFTNAGWAAPIQSVSGTLITSTNYDFQSRFYSAINNVSWVHGGVDFVGPADAPYTTNTPVYAIGDGVIRHIVREESTTNNNSRLHIEHTAANGAKFLAIYGHAYATPRLSVGDIISKGAQIGTLRLAGDPMHLHFELNTELHTTSFGSVKSGTVDPLQFLIDNPADSDKDYVVSVILVIDVSGSMADRWEGGIKMDSARQAALSLLDVLEEENARLGYRYNVAIVDFAHNASVVQSFTSDFSRLREAVASLNPSGATNIGDGLEKAFQQLHAAEYDRALVILLSDGMTNRGRNPEEIVRWLEERVKPVSVPAPEGLQISMYGADYSLSDPPEVKFQDKDWVNTTKSALRSAELLKEAGFQSTAYINQTKEVALENLLGDAVFCFAGHGSPDSLTFLDHNNKVAMNSNEVRPLTLDSLFLAVLAGCNTARNITRQDNILRTFVESGALVGTGFNQFLFMPTVNRWRIKFWETMVDGATVKEASLAATAEGFFRSGFSFYKLPSHWVVNYPVHMAERIRLVEVDTIPAASAQEKDPPRVYTVGFGNPGDLDEDLLISIARITGGEYFYGGQADALQNIFLRTQHQGTGQVHAEFEGSILQGQEVEAGQFTLPRGESELRVTLNWPGSHLDLRLYDPQGRLVDADYRGVKVWRTERPAYVVLENPRAGDWRVEVYGHEVPADGTSYYVVASTSDIPATKSGLLEPLMIMAFLALIGFIWVPRWLQSQYMGNGVSGSIKICPRCGGAIHETDRFCSDCGLSQQENTRRGFSLRHWAILALSLFLILGFMQLIGGRLVFSPGKEASEVRQESDVPILGKVYDQHLRDTWEYSGGMMEEYVAYNNAGNRLTIYQDLESGELQGFTAALPAAANINLSLEEARQSAERVARHFPFFTDPTLRLKEEVLVSHGPDTEQYYSFHWLAEDPATKAVLLREIRIGVHPENGGIIYLLTEDSGEVTISTAPSIAGREARNLASSQIEEFLQRPRVVKEVLYVSTEHVGQRLLWLIVFEETARDALPQRVYVDLDAHTGEILGVGN